MIRPAVADRVMARYPIKISLTGIGLATKIRTYKWNRSGTEDHALRNSKLFIRANLNVTVTQEFFAYQIHCKLI